MRATRGARYSFTKMAFERPRGLSTTTCTSSGVFGGTSGTVTEIWLSLAEVTVPFWPAKVTVLASALLAKPSPLRVTVWPISPRAGSTADTTGGGRRDE